jgi:hypothetical protein
MRTPTAPPGTGAPAGPRTISKGWDGWLTTPRRGWTILTAVKHREAYEALLSTSLRDRLIATLVDEGILTLLKAHALRVVDAAPVPYVRLEIVAGEGGLVAHCTGVWFDA